MPTGDEWYFMQASRAVNQAFGRLIRHKNDYGAILLCDCRFNYPPHKYRLSSWIQGHLLRNNPNQTFGPMISEIVRFFETAEWTVSTQRNFKRIHMLYSNHLFRLLFAVATAYCKAVELWMRRTRGRRSQDTCKNWVVEGNHPRNNRSEKQLNKCTLLDQMKVNSGLPIYAEKADSNVSFLLPERGRIIHSMVKNIRFLSSFFHLSVRKYGNMVHIDIVQK